MGTLTVEQTAHKARIESELRSAGLGWLSSFRFSPRYLYRFIRPDEHIVRAASGRYRATKESTASESGILVATDDRALFLDRKLGYVRMNDIPYDSIKGLETAQAGPFGSVTLFTGGGVFTMLYVWGRQREEFVDYVKKRQLGNQQV